MHDLELNKILAACLVAGIIASASGFVAHKAIHPHAVKAHGEEASGEAGAPAAAMPEPILELIAKADVEHGKTLTKVCAACHNFEKGGASGLGPNLWNILSRGKAAKDDFTKYSAEMLKRKGEKWAYADLNHFLWKPKSLVPGTAMNFAGLKKAQDRADVIAFLRTLADSPPGLPSDGEIAAEKKELGPKEAPADTKKSEEKGTEKTDGNANPAAEGKAADKTPDKKSDKKSGKRAKDRRAEAAPEPERTAETAAPAAEEPAGEDSEAPSPLPE